MGNSLYYSDGSVRPSVNRSDSHHANGNSSPSVRVMLLMSTLLDCELLSALFSACPGIRLVGWSSDFDFGLARCRQLRPKLLFLDPKVDSQAVDLAADMVRSGFVEHLIVVDDRVHEDLVAQLLAMPSVSYLTRQAGMDSLYAATMKIAQSSVRVFDPAIDHRVLRTPHGLRLEQLHDQPSITKLTTREREVMQLLAVGNSVRDCARQMHLAESTIDNHKSRLMKKLRIHKSAKLTYVAIRDGLITV